MNAHPSPPSGLFTSELPRVLESARLGPVADLACGRGRHALAAAAAGAPTLALDRDAEALRELVRAGAGRPLLGVRTDLETEHGIPIRSGSCGVILVFRFWFPPLAGEVVRALAPGGLLLYETFTREQPGLGWGPRNPDFLLRPGELAAAFSDLEVLAVHEGIVEDPRPAALARLVARKR